jgi:hypothetical protein
MSNLNHTPLAALTDTEDLIEITSYDEMVSRPAFERDLNPKVVKLEKITGHYRFRDFVRCGLSNCHHNHQKGYLVVASGGQETNIGHMCGKTHFGQEFDSLRNSYESRRRVRDYRERLGQFRAMLPALYAQIRELRECERGAEWLYGIQRSFREGCPQALLDNLQTRARTGDTLVYKTIVLEGADAELRLAAEGKLSAKENNPNGKKQITHTVQEPLGKISGLPIWGTSIRGLLVDGLERDLVNFEQMAVYNLSEVRLRVLVGFADSVGEQIARCEALLADGRLFFTDENFALVRQITLSREAARALRRNRWDNRKGVWKS